MKKKTLILSGTVILVMIAVIGIFVKLNQPETVYMSASWMYGYADVEDLTKHSDLIALIKVDKLSQNIEKAVPGSIYEVTVLDGVLGCEKEEKLSIYMSGGQNKNQLFEFSDDPLMKRGQEFLIFAQKNEDETYTILGGPQGRLLYRDGVLNSLKNTELPHTSAKSKTKAIENTEPDGTVNVKNESVEAVKEKIYSVIGEDKA